MSPTGYGYSLEDSFVHDFIFVGGHRHAAIQDIEGKSIRTTNERSNGLLQDRNLFCKIEPTHLVGATGTE